MQSANNMEFRHRLGVSGSRSLESLFQGHGVCARSIFLAPKGAQTAGSHTYVGGVQMAVNVEIRFVPMHPFADIIRHPADRQNVTSTVESNRIGLVEADAGKNLFMNWPKSGIVSLE